MSSGRAPPTLWGKAMGKARGLGGGKPRPGCVTVARLIGELDTVFGQDRMDAAAYSVHPFSPVQVARAVRSRPIPSPISPSFTPETERRKCVQAVVDV